MRAGRGVAHALRAQLLAQQFVLIGIAIEAEVGQALARAFVEHAPHMRLARGAKLEPLVLVRYVEAEGGEEPLRLGERWHFQGEMID
ncbi:hypothetical protein D3C87_1495760 [compost metagenome]